MRVEFELPGKGQDFFDPGEEWRSRPLSTKTFEGLDVEWLQKGDSERNIPYRFLLPEGWTIKYTYRDGVNKRLHIYDTQHKTRFYIALGESPDGKYANIYRRVFNMHAFFQMDFAKI